MSRHLFQIALIVPEYDEAIKYYTETLSFRLLEDTDRGNGKRWVVVSPGEEDSCRILLAKAKNEEQKAAIGNQCGGRVFLFLHTNDFQRDFDHYVSMGVTIIDKPREEEYGRVVVFVDKYGHKWDLIEPVG